MIDKRMIVLGTEKAEVLTGPTKEVEDQIRMILKQAEAFGIYEAKYQQDQEGYIHVHRVGVTDCKQDILIAYIWQPRGRANYKN